MLVLLGYVVVLGSVFGGYGLMGGHFGALYQPLELLMIGGAAVGAFVAGAAVLGEPLTPMRVTAAVLIVSGLVLMKLSS